MSERIRGSYDDALYKSTFTLLYFTLLKGEAVSVFMPENYEVEKLKRASSSFYMRDILTLLI